MERNIGGHMQLPGWGTLAGKIAEWFPSREESIRRNIDTLKRRRDALLKEPSTPANSNLYADICERLRKEELKLESR